MEDAVNPTRAAVEEGVVPGGGVALLRARRAIKDFNGKTDDQTVGVNILKRALEEPLRQIVRNSGLESREKLLRIQRCDYGKFYGKGFLVSLPHPVGHRGLISNAQSRRRSPLGYWSRLRDSITDTQVPYWVGSFVAPRSATRWWWFRRSVLRPFVPVEMPPLW